MKANPDRVSHYLVTGVDCKGKRFRIKTVSRLHAESINVWKGSLWFVDTNGRRQLWRRYRN